MESYHYSPQASSWVLVTEENNSSSAAANLTPHHPPKERRNSSNTTKRSSMKLSTDPQSVAARQRRHRISDRFRVLKGLVPGGSKMDTVSMLEEAINYVKFLKAQIWLHQATEAAMMAPHDQDPSLINLPSYNYTSNYLNTATSFGNNVTSVYSASVVPSDDQEMLSYSLPPLPPTLAQDEDQEKMAHNLSINYY